MSFSEEKNGVRLNKCKIITYTNRSGVKETVAVTTYAGRPVRAFAKCNPEDSYDEEFGATLAKYRCNQKVAEKRVKRATTKYNEAVDAYISAVAYLEKMKEYLNDAQYDYEVAQSVTDKFLDGEIE